MRDGHVRIRGARVKLQFKGKSGVRHELELRDRRLARVVRQCRDLPGQELFQYVDDDGRVVDVGSDDVNAYLRACTGTDFTSKDFRTWAGTVLAARYLCEADRAGRGSRTRAAVVRAIDEVARHLGNTRAVCRKCYVHPAIVDAYLDGTLVKAMGRPTESEAAVLRLLGRRKVSAPRASRRR